MNKQVQPHESSIEERAERINESIEERAERIKQATSEKVASTKEAVNRTADRVEDGLHRVTDKAAGAATYATDKVADVSERGRAAYGEAVDRADEWLDEVREYVREKPVQAVAIALGAGWLLGRILRR
jgi:ElaB/YqjD/DUF883 family membrane-anchored ribosome-binding protein